MANRRFPGPAATRAWRGSPAGRDSGVSVEEGQTESDRAMSWLRRAVTMGYGNLDSYRNETALDPLRHRPDFQLLMMDLVFPAEPFARGDHSSRTE